MTGGSADGQYWESQVRDFAPVQNFPDCIIPTMPDTIFAKIIRREIPATFVHEDDKCVAFRDVNPQAPTHILIVPKESIATLSEADANHQSLLGHLLLTAKNLAAQLGLGDGYRLVINNGAAAGQTVFHLHVHLLAGRSFKWPPG